MKRDTILLIVLILALVISDVSALGIGIAPSRFTVDDAVKGEAYDKVLRVSNPADESCNYELFVETGDISDWISFYALDGKTPIATIELPGKSSEKVIARLLVPAEAPNGVYTGKIYVQTIPESASGNTTNETGAVAQAVLNAPSEVTIVVTDGVPAEEETRTIEGNLISISTVDELQIGQVIEILAFFENIGTIDTNAQFVGVLYIDGNQVEDVTSDELLTPAGKASGLTAYVSIETPGEYIIKGHVLYEGKKTDTKEGKKTDTKELSFSVSETESATDSGTETETESETPAVTGTHAVTETPTPTSEADLATETPAGTEADTDTKVPGFGFIGALIATFVVFVIAKKSGQKRRK
jgi:hypothetical protein